MNSGWGEGEEEAYMDAKGFKAFYRDVPLIELERRLSGSAGTCENQKYDLWKTADFYCQKYGLLSVCEVIDDLRMRLDSSFDDWSRLKHTIDFVLKCEEVVAYYEGEPISVPETPLQRMLRRDLLTEKGKGMGQS